jgi:hypothetical protein
MHEDCNCARPCRNRAKHAFFERGRSVAEHAAQMTSARLSYTVARMFEDILSGFTSSPHCESAVAALVQQGIGEGDARNYIDQAIPAAAEAFTKQTANHPQPEVGLFNIFGGHAGKEFLIGLTEGIVRGDGIMGSLEDGGMSMVGGHIGEYLASKTGLPEETTGLVAAAVTPFIVRFVHEKLAERN